MSVGFGRGFALPTPLRPANHIKPCSTRRPQIHGWRIRREKDNTRCRIQDLKPVRC